LATDERLYLHKVLPRFYADVLESLKATRPELIAQLDYLYVTGRCPCGDGGCVQFYCESAQPGVAPVGVRRPAYFDLPGLTVGVMIGVGRGDILTGFEVLSDYQDGAIQAGLESHGFPKSVNSEDSGYGAPE
jgi:hypothetical protein